MRRAAFTVKLANGIAYDANHLAITSKQVFGDGEGEAGTISMVSFVCSGEQHSFPASEVQEIAFFKAGASHCSECDASLWDTLGAHIHDNPKPMES